MKPIKCVCGNEAPAQVRLLGEEEGDHCFRLECFCGWESGYEDSADEATSAWNVVMASAQSLSVARAAAAEFQAGDFARSGAGLVFVNKEGWAVLTRLFEALGTKGA